MSPKISLGTATSNVITGTTSATQAIADIRDGKWAAQVAAVRAATGNQRAELKRKLPAIIWSGTFSRRAASGLIHHSGLICADIDKVPDRLKEIVITAWNDPHVVAAFVSPTGTGLKIIFRTESFDSVREHVASHYQATVDEAAKDVARLCFVSHDPEAFYNDEAKPLPTVELRPTANRTATMVLTAPGATASRTEIANRLLGSIEWIDATTGFCKCPGEHLHTTHNGPKDCKVMLDGVPTLKCFHGSCKGIVDGVNHELRSQIGKLEPSLSAADSTQADIASHFKNDIGYGDRFVERHAKTIRYCADEKLWLVFDEVAGWRRDTTGHIKSMAADFARELYRDAARKAASMEPDEGKRIITSVAALGNKKRIEPALSFASCNPAIVVTSEQLDADPFLVGVENGVVNLRDGSFQKHHHDHLVTRRLAVIFDPNAAAPNFERFLAEVQPDAEMRAFLQRLSGYGITGETRDHVLPFHYGVGANGKGTFLEHTMLKLTGTYGAKLTDSLVYASDRGHLPHLELANLCGKRFALGEENTDGGKLNEALLKSITGGDRQKGRFHYGNFVECFPTYKIALVGNHKPRITGTDDGIWRRFRLVDWPVQIPAEMRDGKLKDKLAGEMSGILNWCIAGAIAWQAEGLNPPESCTVATADFRQKSDLLVEFITECFEKDADGYCTKAETFTAYQQWASQSGVTRMETMSKRSLGNALITRGWSEGKGTRENCHVWYGWRLKNVVLE